MAIDIGPKIGIDGEAQFRRELAQINQSMKVLDSEARAVTAAMENETDAEKKSAAQKDVLNRQISTQREKLEKLEQGLVEAGRKFGEADTRTLKWKQAVLDAQGALSKMENQLRGTDNEVEDIAGDLDDAKEATTGWADVMKGSLLAEATKAGLSWLKDTISEAASAIWDASKAGAAYADEINTMATVEGISQEKLQEYRYMADLIDVSVDTITGSMTKLEKGMASARKGQGDAYEIFQALGISVEDSSGKFRDAEDVYADTIAALAKIENPTERDTAAMTLLGKSAKDLNPLIEAGADKLKDLAKEAHDTGYVLSGSALTALNRQQDAMDRLDKKTEALSNRFASRMAPAVEKAAGKMLELADNPRVQRGLDLVADSVGDLIDGAAELASKILPDIFRLITDDPALKYLSDDTLALMKATGDAKEKYEGLIGSYKENAGAVLDEKGRVEDLWKELQELVGWNGQVKQSDQDRVDYILGELNDALGTEYTRNGEIIEQYQDMQREIQNLIEKKTAASMIEMFNETYTESKSEANELLQRAADARLAMYEARDAWQEAVTSLSAANQEELEEAYLEAKKSYEDAQELAGAAFDNIRRMDEAQAAFMKGNYKSVITILGDETQATIEYYKTKEKLTEEDKKKFEKAIQDMEAGIVEYKIALENGTRGFSKEGLKELEDYAATARRILNGEEIANSYMDGLVRGLRAKSKLKEVEAAATNTATTIVTATRGTLMISSPSKVSTYFGEMWPAGLVKGMKSREDEVRKESERLSSRLIGGTAARFSTSAGYYGGSISAPIGGYGSTQSYSTRIGSITVTVPGAGAVNEDVLAQRVAVRLTQQLNRANSARGG